MIWSIEYKCRRCGKVYPSFEGSKEACVRGVIDFWMKGAQNFTQPIDLHPCGNDCYGLADIVGCAPSQQDPPNAT